MAKEDRQQKQIRKLRDGAANLVAKGKHEKALKKYLELEELDPNDAQWSKRVADCYRRMGRRPDELQALVRAADGYSRTGFLLKAVAMCKLVLAIDPQHTQTLERMAKLHAAQTTGLDRFGGAARPGLTMAQRPAAAPDEVPPPEASEGAADDVAALLDETSPVLPEGSAPAVPGAPGHQPGQAEVELPVPPDDGLSLDEGPAPVELRAAAEAAGPLPELTASSTARAEPASADAGTGQALADAGALEELQLSRHVECTLRSQLPAHSSGIYELNLDEIDSLDDLLEEGQSEQEPPEDTRTRWSRRVRETATDLLPRTPLFSELSQEVLMRLVERLDLRILAAGDTACREGEPAEEMFVVAEGSVQVIKEGPPAVELAQLGEGDFFGEIGLVSDTPRVRTVVALEDTQLLVLDRATVRELIDNHPTFLKILLRFLRYRLIAPLLETSPLFAPFSVEERRAMAKKFQFLELESGAVVIEEGKRASGLFVLLSGEAQVFRGQEEHLATLHPGDVFGEMSLLTNQPAVGTVRTTKKCFALEMPAARFTETVMVNPQVLIYVSELADQRRRANETTADETLEFS